MRLFLALFPPKETQAQLRDVLRRFDKQKRNLQNVPIDQMHVTLKFLGPDVSEYSKDILVDEFRSLEKSFGSVSVQIKKVRFGFEKEYNPRILIAELVRSEKLVEVTMAFHEAVKNCKLRDTIRFKRRYQYNYHITLSRMKKTATKSTGHMIKGTAKRLDDIQFKPFDVDRVFLMESTFNKNAPLYRKLETFML